MNKKTDHYSYSLYAKQDFAQKYEKDRFGSDFGLFLKSYECDQYAQFIPQFTRLLDVGTGSGKLAASFSKQGEGTVVASDASFEMARIARDNIPGNKKFVVVCDAHHLCFKKGAFDAVTSSRVLMHLVNWQKAVKELCRVSNDRVVLDFPAFISFTIVERIFRRLKGLFSDRTQSYQGFFTSTVGKEFQNNNFAITGKSHGFFLPVAFYRFINSAKLALKFEQTFEKIKLARFFGTPVTLLLKRKENK